MIKGLIGIETAWEVLKRSSPGDSGDGIETGKEDEMR